MSDQSHKGPNPYASGKHTQSIAQQTQGKMYRVQEPGGSKIYNPKPLAWVDAHKLKEKLCGERKSTQAEIVLWDAPRPASAVAPRQVTAPAMPNQPAAQQMYTLEQLQQASQAAAQKAASDAQARHEELMRRHEAEQKIAAELAAADQPLPGDGLIDEQLPGLSPGEIDDLVGGDDGGNGLPSEADFQHAQDANGVADEPTAH